MALTTIKIFINRSGKSIPIYQEAFVKSKQIGTIMPNELYVETGQTGGGSRPISLYTPNGWKNGYTDEEYVMPSNSMVKAYASSYAYGKISQGYKFKVLHRQSRIFSGENVVAAVQPGGYIVTDGESSGGEKKFYRLSIKGYIHANSSKFVPVTNGWCDTDLEIGKTMYNTVTIDGLWV
ncbi:hypothetical protein ACTNDN_06970 [Niallia sp. HCP3S3_B10]|uniref:hypothetical protein n=1 Tax=Niallia sp. HCP3S3_B10 TaxID=3438944 RepID=UPI003F897A28